MSDPFPDESTVFETNQINGKDDISINKLVYP